MIATSAAVSNVRTKIFNEAITERQQMNIRDILEQLDMIETGCPECGGPISLLTGLEEGKKDACYYKIKASAKVWPSAYASGRLVQCRKKGAANYGKK